MGQHLEQFLERREIVALDGGGERRLDAMVARNVGGIDRVHRGAAGVGILRFARQALAPAGRPGVIGGGLGEQRPRRGVRLGVERAEGQGEVGLPWAMASRKSCASAASPSSSVDRPSLRRMPASSALP